MVYKFAHGSVIPRVVSAQELGDWLDGLCRESGVSSPNELPKKHIVEAAWNDKSSAGYKVFSAKGLWNDKHAAVVARLNFAGDIIRSIRVVYVVKVGSTNKKRTRRGFVSVISKDKQRRRRVFVPFTVAVDDEEYREQMLEDARRAFMNFKEKYFELKELAVLWTTGTRVFGKARRKAA